VHETCLLFDRSIQKFCHKEVHDTTAVQTVLVHFPRSISSNKSKFSEPTFCTPLPIFRMYVQFDRTVLTVRSQVVDMNVSVKILQVFEIQSFGLDTVRTQSFATRLLPCRYVVQSQPRNSLFGCVESLL